MSTTCMQWGREIAAKLTGQPVFTSFQRKDKAKTLGEPSAVPVTGDRTIDPAILFQRLEVISQKETFYWKTFLNMISANSCLCKLTPFPGSDLWRFFF